MVWCYCYTLNSSQIAPLEGVVLVYFNLDAKIDTNKVLKNTGTKMHKCLVGIRVVGSNTETKLLIPYSNNII